MTPNCPFSNLPDRRSGSFGQGMKACTWVNPAAVAEIEFAEWTPDERLRHAAFMGLRSDKNPQEVVRET